MCSGLSKKNLSYFSAEMKIKNLFSLISRLVISLLKHLSKNVLFPRDFHTFASFNLFFLYSVSEICFRYYYLNVDTILGSHYCVSAYYGTLNARNSPRNSCDVAIVSCILAKSIDLLLFADKSLVFRMSWKHQRNQSRPYFPYYLR